MEINHTHVELVPQTDHRVRVDVTWSYGGKAPESCIYRRRNGASGWQIGVLTPLDIVTHSDRLAR